MASAAAAQPRPRCAAADVSTTCDVATEAPLQRNGRWRGAALRACGRQTLGCPSRLHVAGCVPDTARCIAVGVAAGAELEPAADAWLHEAVYSSSGRARADNPVPEPVRVQVGQLAPVETSVQWCALSRRGKRIETSVMLRKALFPGTLRPGGCTHALACARADANGQGADRAEAAPCFGEGGGRRRRGAAAAIMLGRCSAGAPRCAHAYR